jgi:hypothetical protein
MQAARLPSISAVGKEALIGNLPCSLTSTLIDSELGNWRNTIPRRAQRFDRLVESEAERANNPRGHDSNARFFYVQNVTCRNFHGLTRSISCCFLKTKHFTKEPKGENSSSVVGGLSVEFIQRRFEIR